MSDAPEELGPYLVYEQLGSGGMASVHRAEARGIAGFRRLIALKRLHPHIAADEQLLKSFVHEARLASNLHHTNVAQTYDLGKVDDTYFIAMEYVPGPTLTQVIRQCTRSAGPIPLPIVLEIVIQICDALDYAHNLCDDAGKPLNIVHRDISPSNIIISNTGIVKLIDFGIAKADSSNVHTQTGFIKGKYGYVAPEYIVGRLDARADLFGVGVLAHELLSTRPLFLGRNDFETLTRLREMPIPLPSRWNPAVTADLDDIVMTALQRDPDQRWQSAAAMRTAVANITRALGIGVTQQQVFQWVEWAFSQVPPQDATGLATAIDALDAPSIQIDLDGASDLFARHGYEPERADDPVVPPPRPREVARPAPAAGRREIDGAVARPAPAAGRRDVEEAGPRSSSAAGRDVERAVARPAPAAGRRDVEEAGPRSSPAAGRDVERAAGRPAPAAGRRDVEEAGPRSSPAASRRELEAETRVVLAPRPRDVERADDPIAPPPRPRDVERADERVAPRARDLERADERIAPAPRARDVERVARASTPTIEVPVVTMDAVRGGPRYATSGDPLPGARSSREPGALPPREPGRRDDDAAGPPPMPGVRPAPGTRPPPVPDARAAAGMDPAAGARPPVLDARAGADPAPGVRPPRVPDGRAAGGIDPAAAARPPQVPEARGPASIAPGLRLPPDPRSAATAEAGSAARPPRIPGARPAPVEPTPGAADIDQTETAPRSRLELRDLERAGPRAEANATVERAANDPRPAASATSPTSEPARRDVGRPVRRSAPQATSEPPSLAFDETLEVGAGDFAATRPASRAPAAPSGEPSARDADSRDLDDSLRKLPSARDADPRDLDDPRRKHASTGVMLVAPSGDQRVPAARPSSHLAGWIFVVLVVAAATASVVADLLELTLDL